MKKKILSVCVALVLLVTGLTFTSMADEEKTIDQIGAFEIQGATAELGADSLNFTLTEDSATIKFIRPLAASGFSFRWNGIEDTNKKLETLTMTLTDSKEENCCVKLIFGKLNDRYTSVKLNEQKRAYLTAGATYKENQSEIAIVFNEKTNTFTDDQENYKLSVEQCLNGDSFDGFSSMGVYMELVMTGEKGATFSLKSINGQPFGSDYSIDDVDPVLCIPDMQKKVLKDAVVTLLPAAAYDVFSDVRSLKLTVQDPEGNIVEDESGTKLEDVDGNEPYQIKFSQYGQYRIIYVASDGVNTTRGMGYQINVNDTGVPNIELKKAMKQTVTVGEEIVFPEVTIKDNAKGECTSWMNVKHPSGIITCEKESFTPKTEGIYVLTFSAQDASGNVGRLTVEIFAEGGSES